MLIRGGRVVTATGEDDADVLIEDGRIAAIGASGTLESGDGAVIDASGQLVMPGGVDSHVHMAHPIDSLGITTADDFHSGTVAAAAGGVTTIIDFALQRKGQSLAETVAGRIARIEPEAVIDYVRYQQLYRPAGLRPGKPEE